MDLNDYQKQALQSVAITEKTITALAHRGFGLSGEAGHITDILKKSFVIKTVFQTHKTLSR